MLYSNITSRHAGFTLIELLVVISIIALMSSVVLVTVSNARMKARDAKRVGDMNQLNKAMELFFNQYNSYPTVASAVNFSSNPTLGSPSLVPLYLNQLPKAPLPADGGCGTGSSGNGINDYYMYRNSVAPYTNITNTYIITFCLGATAGSLGPGPHTLTAAGFQ